MDRTTLPSINVSGMRNNTSRTACMRLLGRRSKSPPSGYSNSTSGKSWTTDSSGKASLSRAWCSLLVACFHRGGGSAPLEVFHPWLRHSLAAGREATAHPRMRQFSHPQLPLEAGRHAVLLCSGHQIWPVWLDSTLRLM
jgi:hypothetical protein